MRFDLKVKIHMNVESRGNELWTGLRLPRESRNFENIISRQRKMKRPKIKLKKILSEIVGKHSWSCIATFRLMIRPAF